ncbi:phosphatase PAP2 family protein [Patescibacteria group bacterium]|nr:phosphatase PAP2 family protein [Patescibacteria group bacterium]
MLNSLFIFGAKYLFVLSFVLSGIFFLRQDWTTKKRIIYFAIPSLVLIFLLSIIANHLYFNPRPFVVGNYTPLIPHANDNGFPSDHVLLVSSVAAIFYYFNRKLSFILWFIASVVAISRVYVGVHHFLDVFTSMFLSFVGVYPIYYFFKLKGFFQPKPPLEYL